MRRQSVSSGHAGKETPPAYLAETLAEVEQTDRHGVLRERQHLVVDEPFERVDNVGRA